VRITRIVGAALPFLAGLLFCGASARAQDAQVMLPEQSAAKAKEILQQTIQALGGQAYLNVRDASCTGRYGQFGHSGALEGYEQFFEFTKLPDKDRTEHSKKRNIIEVYNGDKGWIMDRGGVQDAPADALKDFQDNTKKDIDYILRSRLREPGMIFRYAGPDIVDLKESDWVELVDSEGRTIRLAIDRATHFPIRKVIITRDPTTRLRSEEVDYYSEYFPANGVQTPLKFTHERNGQKVFQVFFEECKFNTGLSDSLFTRESLDERYAQVGKKDKKKGK
jgi:outer membrane lipoprotein-sorting protein